MTKIVAVKLDIPLANSITLSNYLGITDRHVRRLASEGIIGSVSKGKYDIIDCVKKYTSYLRHNNGSTKVKKEVKVDYESERALHEKVKREKAELQFRVIKNELHQSEHVETIMGNMIANAKAQLLSIPVKAAPMVIGHTDIPRIQSILQKVVYEALEELASYDPEVVNNNSMLVDVSNNEGR